MQETNPITTFKVKHFDLFQNAYNWWSHNNHWKLVDCFLWQKSCSAKKFQLKRVIMPTIVYCDPDQKLWEGITESLFWTKYFFRFFFVKLWLWAAEKFICNHYGAELFLFILRRSWTLGKGREIFYTYNQTCVNVQLRRRTSCQQWTACTWNKQKLILIILEHPQNNNDPF